uniref:Apelin receptor early endogenous ligand n=1 Tax=Ciona savignyi TaxID=51511 RepID=H2YTB5_CIOSA
MNKSLLLLVIVLVIMCGKSEALFRRRRPQMLEAKDSHAVANKRLMNRRQMMPENVLMVKKKPF